MVESRLTFVTGENIYFFVVSNKYKVQKAQRSKENTQEVTVFVIFVAIYK